jgi:hypothetical protein
MCKPFTQLIKRTITAKDKCSLGMLIQVLNCCMKLITFVTNFRFSLLWMKSRPDLEKPTVCKPFTQLIKRTMTARDKCSLGMLIQVLNCCTKLMTFVTNFRFSLLWMKSHPDLEIPTVCKAFCPLSVNSFYTKKCVAFSLED